MFFMFAILVILAIIVIAVACLYGIVVHNSLVSMRNHVANGWSQVDVQLTRRHDLIPRLVATVKGYASHEASVLESVVNARTRAIQAVGPEATGNAETQLDTALLTLKATVENYPDLKASANFVNLQNELVGTENRIATARRIYNDNVREYNTKQQTMPSNFIARLMKLDLASFYRANIADRAVPKIGGEL